MPAAGLDAISASLQRVTQIVLGKSSASLSTSSLYPTNRVGQLDAAILDDELFDIFKNQIYDGSKYLHVCINCASIA